MKNFKCVLGAECYKAFHSRFFWISLLTGCLFGLLSGLYSIEGYWEVRESLMMLGGNPMTQAFGLYNSWIGGESSSLGFVFFFTLFPVLAALPYGWSYQEEVKSGYLKIAEVRAGRLRYLGAKYIAAFLAGGGCVVLPLIGNFILTACFVPAVKPSILYEIYYPMHYGAICSELFFEHPFLFVVMYWCIDFIFGGLFAAMAMATGFFSKKRIVALLGPFLFVLMLQYARTFLFGIVYREISPLYFLHATSVENIADGRIIFAEALLIFAVTCGIVFGGGKKRENI